MHYLLNSIDGTSPLLDMMFELIAFSASWGCIPLYLMLGVCHHGLACPFRSSVLHRLVPNSSTKGVCSIVRNVLFGGVGCLCVSRHNLFDRRTYGCKHQLTIQQALDQTSGIGCVTVALKSTPLSPLLVAVIAITTIVDHRFVSISVTDHVRDSGSITFSQSQPKTVGTR